MPCPECGLPVATHTWPLLLVLAVGKLAQRRAKRDIPPTDHGGENDTEVQQAKAGNNE